MMRLFCPCLLYLAAGCCACSRTESTSDASPQPNKATTVPAATAAASQPAAPVIDQPVTVTKDGDIVTRERSLGAVPAGAATAMLTGNGQHGGKAFIAFSDDGNHWACVDRQPKGDVLVVDGKPQKTYSQVTKIEFSPVGNHIAVVAGAPYSLSHITPRQPSPTTNTFVTLDGVEGPQFDEVRGDLLTDTAYLRGERPGRRLVFSPDGKRLAYCGVRGGKDYLVLDNKEHGPYQQVMSLCFSDDSVHFGYLVKDAAGVVMPIVDGTEHPEFGGRGFNLCFSPNGKSWAVAFSKQKNAQLEDCKIIVRGEVSAEYPSFGSTFVFSPDSRHVVTTPGRDMGSIVSIDGRSILQSKGPCFIQFLTSPPRIYFHDAISWGIAPLEKGASSPISQGDAPYMSPDGRRTVDRLNYSIDFAKFGPGNVFAVGGLQDFGNRVPPPGKIPVNVFLEDQKSANYDVVLADTVTFSNDGRHIVFAARRDENWLIVSDFHEVSKRYSRISPRPVVFDGPSSFHTLVERDGQMWLASVTTGAPLKVVRQ